MFYSVYIAAFEVLKIAIVERIRNFYFPGFGENAPRIDPKYQAEVLAKNKSPVYASLDWLKESRVINDDDMATFERVKGLRNDLALNNGDAKALFGRSRPLPGDDFAAGQNRALVDSQRRYRHGP